MPLEFGNIRLRNIFLAIAMCINLGSSSAFSTYYDLVEMLVSTYIDALKVKGTPSKTNAELSDEFMEKVIITFSEESVTKYKALDADIKAEMQRNGFDVSKLEDSAKGAENCKEAIKQIINDILQVPSGRHLINSVNELIPAGGTINFVIEKPDDSGISALPSSTDSSSCGTIWLNLVHLYTATDFVVYDNDFESTEIGGHVPAKEKFARPDVYIFRELLHLMHALADRVMYNNLSVGILAADNADIEKIKGNMMDISGIELDEFGKLLCDFFPLTLQFDSENSPRDSVDYEELRTIIGLPLVVDQDKPRNEEHPISENSYRKDKGYPLRINLLDYEDLLIHSNSA